MGITVLKHNIPWGPFTRAQIEDGLARGDFTLQYLAHAPGLKQWLPLGEVLHLTADGPSLPPVPGQAALPPLPPTTSSPSDPRRVPVLPPPISEEARRLAAPPVAPPVQAPVAEPEPHLETASFFQRAIAFVFDCGILFVPIILLFSLGALILQLQGWVEHTDAESMHQQRLLIERDFHQLLLLIAIVLAWLYAAGMEASGWQATFGKIWMGLKVTDRQGERISFLRATGRHAGKFLSALPCFLGFFIALFSSRGLTLHDRLADTRVIRR